MQAGNTLPRRGAVLTPDRALADTDTLARYWNDALPHAVNVETIAWWLNQAAAFDHVDNGVIDTGNDEATIATPENYPTETSANR